MGFADNVFDQKRAGKRESGLNGPMTIAHLAGKKRAIEPNGQDGPSTPLRKLDLPTPEPDFSNRIFMSREGSEFAGLSHYVSSTLPPILPGVKAVTDLDTTRSVGAEHRYGHFSPSTPRFSLSNGVSSLAPLLQSNAFASP